MGLLALNRLVSLQRPQKRRRRRRRVRIRAPNGIIASLAIGENESSCQHDDNSQGGKRTRYSGPDLPEDIWRHIHFLMPLRDAARAACVSHAFVDSWRRRSDITINSEALGLNENLQGKDETASDFNSKVDNILKKRIGLKRLKIRFCGYNANTHCYLNNWLENAVTPELEELTLLLPRKKAKYTFPCSLLCDGSGNLIQHLQLSWCAFRTTIGLDRLHNLRTLNLFSVHITGDELGCILSSSVLLEQLGLTECNKIICLKIPCVLERLSCLEVMECDMLQVIENKAPNISTFKFSGENEELSLGQTTQVKNLMMHMQCAISYACTKLLPSMPNLETLYIGSCYEVKSPVVPRTFLHLKYLVVSLNEMAYFPAYDCFSLVSFLDAAPLLEAFDLRVVQKNKIRDDSIVGDPSPLRQMVGRRHNNLKAVKILGFCSSKWLIELISYILENATSLDSLTLDTTLGLYRCSNPANKLGICVDPGRRFLRESQRAVWAFEAFIKGKVPPSVKLNVLGNCSSCHEKFSNV